MGEKVVEERPLVLTPDEAKTRISQGSLDLGGATIKGGLDLEGATIKGFIDLSTKEGPRKIYVSFEMAQVVHWAAPTVPLVVVKKPQ